MITGAARGIGEEAARQLAARGARLSLVGLEPERLEALATELGCPDRAVWFEADVRDRDALERAALHSPMMGRYAMAKAGVEAFGDSLRLEVAEQGVDVGVAYFGFIDTDMVRDAFSQPAAAAMRERGPRAIADPIPVARAGEAI